MKGFREKGFKVCRGLLLSIGVLFCFSISYAATYQDWVGKEVYVFRENKKNVWAVLDQEGGRKLFHSKDVVLKDATFFVDENKRQAMIRTRKERPHAGVFGILSSVETKAPKGCPIAIRYNPFEMNWFLDSDSGVPIRGARQVRFLSEGKQGLVQAFGAKNFLKLYSLLNSKGQIYWSPIKAEFGGYAPKKIYGLLDCPSALRWIAKGQYVGQRVFSSEIEFIRAGYRPCGICMRE
jgi:hypothetical protein